MTFLKYFKYLAIVLAEETESARDSGSTTAARNRPTHLLRPPPHVDHPRGSKTIIIHRPQQVQSRLILPGAQKMRKGDLPQMNRTLELLLTLVALAGLYSAIPARAPNASLGARAEQAVVVADGSDPMPLCRKRNCTQ